MTTEQATRIVLPLPEYISIVLGFAYDVKSFYETSDPTIPDNEYEKKALQLFGHEYDETLCLAQKVIC